MDNVTPISRYQEKFFLKTDSGTFWLKQDGIYFEGLRKDGSPLPEVFICSPLNVIGRTRNTQQADWGYLLEWNDFDGHLHRWAAPSTLLGGDSSQLVGELLRLGLDISHGKRERVIEFIQSSRPSKRLICTDKTGWHENAYITPSKVYGVNTDQYIYQTDGMGIETAMTEAGKLSTWSSNVSIPCAGNSRLVFALSSAFAGTLLTPAQIESGGFHLVGNSSCGKSTAQRVAASVWGNPEIFKRSWRATSNGLEGIAALHNDNILILDELSEINPKDASETAYMLGNGQGKQRATKSGTIREAKTWKALFLSSGEVTLQDLLNEDGGKRRVKAGQEVRIANLKADAGANMGIFEALHQFKGAAQLADHLRYETARNYGVAGVAWLESITKDPRNLWDDLPKFISNFCADILPSKASGQASRVAKRFALVAAAGELATQYGITGWNEGEATQAAKRCFNDWLNDFGEGNREEKQILDSVVGFIQRNAASFQDTASKLPVPNRVGFYRETHNTEEYIVPHLQMERLAEGHDKHRIAQVLKDNGLLHISPTGKSTITQRLPGLGKSEAQRCYIIKLPIQANDSKIVTPVTP